MKNRKENVLIEFCFIDSDTLFYERLPLNFKGLLCFADKFHSNFITVWKLFQIKISKLRMLR